MKLNREGRIVDAEVVKEVDERNSIVYGSPKASGIGSPLENWPIILSDRSLRIQMLADVCEGWKLLLLLLLTVTVSRAKEGSTSDDSKIVFPLPLPMQSKPLPHDAAAYFLEQNVDVGSEISNALGLRVGRVVKATQLIATGIDPKFFERTENSSLQPKNVPSVSKMYAPLLSAAPGNWRRTLFSVPSAEEEVCGEAVVVVVVFIMSEEMLGAEVDEDTEDDNGEENEDELDVVEYKTVEFDKRSAKKFDRVEESEENVMIRLREQSWFSRVEDS